MRPGWRCVKAGAAILLCGLALAGLGGCEKRPLYEYTDEPYIRTSQQLDEKRLQHQLQSIYRDERERALRAFAARGAEALAQGRTVEARRVGRLLMAHYRREREVRVRSSIVGICLRQLGLREDGVYAFLRERVAEGDCVSDACHTLVALQAPEAYDTIAPLVDHPRPDVRYEAALALSGLRDARVPAVLREVAASMKTDAWPPAIYGMPLSQCRVNLLSRAGALEAVR
jgi:hypothetical protein